MAQQGLVSFLFDAEINGGKGCGVGEAWAQNLLALAPTPPPVRASWTTKSDGSFPTRKFAGALDVYRRHGITTSVILHQSFAPYYPPGTVPDPVLDCPNAPLGGKEVGYNPLLNRWIDGHTQRAAAILRALPPGNVHALWAGNEGNLLGYDLAQGKNCPPRQDDKSQAQSPEAFAARGWQTALRCKQYVAEVYLGSLSALPLGNPQYWNQFYLERMYAFLERHGHRAPWPWQGVSLNCEGLWTTAQLERVVHLARTVMATHKDTGLLVCGEWGVKNSQLVTKQPDGRSIVTPETLAAVQTTYDAIDRLFDKAFFFQHPGKQPYLGDPQAYSDYGALQWRANGPEFVPGAGYGWSHLLRQLYHGEPLSAPW